MTGDWAITRTVRISRTLSVEMTAGPGGFVCEWLRDRPRRLSRKEIKKYRNARNALLGEVAERLGGNVLVVEI
jgi:hypothetical protein